MVHAQQSGHPGGSLGCTDFLTALYFKVLKHDPAFNMDGKGEDLFFLSNGHISPVFYAVLARSGYFDIKELATFRMINSRLQGHPTTHEHLPGIRIASGSLGQGMSVAIGAALSKKYRDQFKRARKKFEGIQVKNLSYEDVLAQEDALYSLYHYVAKNAPFNTFFLSKDHFSTLKGQCGNRFQIFGYYCADKLVGFHTLLLNEETLETYFLGYDETIQKENMLYLNMLYNMTKYGIENGFNRIIFGRTALEIKSSVGAIPVQMSGFIYHTNPWINRFIKIIFKQLEPKVQWQQRHPFK